MGEQTMMQGMDADKAALLEAGLAKIRERFIASLEDRIESFCTLLERLEDPETEESACMEIRAQAHKLHGICGSVGQPRMGALAAQLEQHIDTLLAGERPLNTDFVDDLLNALLDEMEQNVDGA
ncbi:Hpt domain-containing protein [Cognatishimia maritima]|uniref:Hpt domain-containing protein n=1 Tax=Cognatishimia maritima TaxID=870908 RepID=UPI0013F4EF4B|nr:Hpt domain-containing protein [Cognatishimia maritima]